MAYTHPSRDPTKPDKLRTLERRTKAIEMRARGKSYHEIAKELGVSAKRASEYVWDAIRARQAEQSESVKHHAMLAEMRLNKLVSSLWDKAMAGDIDTVNALIRCEERRAKLLGLDAPARVHVDMNVQVMPTEELVAVAARLGVQAVVQGQEQLSLPACAQDEPEPIPLSPGQWSVVAEVPEPVPASSDHLGDG